MSEEPKIWITTMGVSPDVTDALVDIFEPETDEGLRELFGPRGEFYKLQRGEYYADQYFPKSAWLAPERKNNHLPDFFGILGGFDMVSERFKELLEQFDIGETRFIPATIYEKNRKAPVPGRFYYLNVVSQKRAVDVEASNGAFIVGKYRTSTASSKFNLAKIVIDASALEGADLWMDPQVHEGYYFSDRLKRAIQAAKIKCRGNRNMPFVAVNIRF